MAKKTIRRRRRRRLETLVRKLTPNIIVYCNRLFSFVDLGLKEGLRLTGSR